jgi:prepilin-type processing-associated H-X9-DG protein/prepilin-type N-terminal cleavage/methylation domain-containing protein
MLRKTTAFTLIELLVTVAIVAVLATLGISVVGVVNAKGRATKCANQMRNLGAAALLYAADNEMTLPATTHQRRQRIKAWSITLQEYAGGKINYRCPDNPDKKRAYTYLINDFLTPNPAGAPDLNFSKLSALEQPGRTMLFAEAHRDYLNSDHFHFSDYCGRAVPEEVFAKQVAVEAHADGANYVFADGHVETLSWKEVRTFLRTPGRKFVDPTFE